MRAERSIALVGLVGLLGLAGCGTNGYTGLGLESSGGTDAGLAYSRHGVAAILVKAIGPLSESSQLADLGAQEVGLDPALTAMGWRRLAVPSGSVGKALAEVYGDPNVVAAEPDRELDAPQLPPAPVLLTSGTVLGSSPLPAPNSLQYAPQITRAEEAWSISTGQGQVIAVVDSGIDPGHPDFAGRIAPGWNTIQNTDNDRDDYGHGTHCAGIAAAYASGPDGVMGIAPGATLLPVKVLRADGSGSDSSVASGITWAAEHGATVISLSLGGPADAKVLDDAVAYALSRGCSVVAAMGNAGDHVKSFPAAVPGVIAVGATDRKDRIASFSQYGSWNSVSAPGVGIYSTFPTYHVTLNNEGFSENYASLDGTSMATPAVAGAVADIRAARPRLLPSQIKAILQDSADKVAGRTAFDSHYGYGRIDVLAALRAQ